MTTITLGLITKNNEKTVGDILSQLHSYIDEIIVVDFNSSDDTITIASHFKARIYENDNKNIGDIKNFIIDESLSQYVLFMDCDEILIDPEYLFNIDLESDIYAIQNVNSAKLTYCIKTNSLIRYEGTVPFNVEDAVILNTYSEKVK
jgi:glycosyltransferase involved in cell wall biosynthesis